MKGNGIVSRRGQSIIAAPFRKANPPHARSRSLGRDAIADMADGLDGLSAELLAQTADADVDDVRARIEVVAPHVREQPLAADDLARVHDEQVQEAVVPVGEIADELAEPGDAGGAVDGEALRLESTPEKGEDPGLVLDQEDGHRQRAGI